MAKRLAEVFGRTWRDAPANAVMVSHRLAVRAGIAEPVAPGAWALLPLGVHVMARLQETVRQVFESSGGQAIRLPVLVPDEPEPADDGLSLQDPSSGRSYRIAGAYRQALVRLAARAIDSYKDLPQYLYDIFPQAIPELNGTGLFGLRAYTAAQMFGLCATEVDGQAWAEQVASAFVNLLNRLGLPVALAHGDEAGHEQVLPIRHAQGDTQLASCEACGYTALARAASFDVPDGPSGEHASVEKVATPDCKTIQEVATYLGVPEAQTLKAVFFAQERANGEDRFVFAVVRGDLEIEEDCLRHVLGGGTLRPATDDEIRAAGAVPGYASPIGLPPEVLVVADRSVLAGVNFVAGANEEGYHLTGVNVPRDFEPHRIETIAAVFEGATCGHCHQGALHLEPAFLLGHVLTPVPEPAVTFTDAGGVEQVAAVGVASLWLERVLAALIEIFHDDWGILWPPDVAPFDVHVVTLGRDEATSTQAAEVVAMLEGAGFAVLLDDRTESAGVKFTDADLIGVPVRLTVSKKAMAAGGFEGKRRESRERVIIAPQDVVGWVREQLATRDK